MFGFMYSNKAHYNEKFLIKTANYDYLLQSIIFNPLKLPRNVTNIMRSNYPIIKLTLISVKVYVISVVIYWY